MTGIRSGIFVVGCLAVMASAIEVNLGRGAAQAPAQQGAPIQFAQPGMAFPQQAPKAPAQQAPAQKAAPVQQAPAQQPTPQQAPKIDANPFGMGGFNFPGLNNAASNFFPGMDAIFSDIANKAPAFPNGQAPSAKNQAPSAQFKMPEQPVIPGAADAAAPQAAPVAQEAPVLGGWREYNRAVEVAGQNPFQAIAYALETLQAFRNGQASGATVLVYLASQIVAGTNYRVVFKLDAAYLGVVVFVPLGGAAPVVKEIVYNDNLGNLLRALRLPANVQFKLNARIQEVQPQDNQAAPDLTQAAFAGLGAMAPRGQAPQGFQGPQMAAPQVLQRPMNQQPQQAQQAPRQAQRPAPQQQAPQNFQVAPNAAPQASFPVNQPQAAQPVNAGRPSLNINIGSQQ